MEVEKNEKLKANYLNEVRKIIEKQYSFNFLTSAQQDLEKLLGEFIKNTK